MDLHLVSSAGRQFFQPGFSDRSAPRGAQKTHRKVMGQFAANATRNKGINPPICEIPTGISDRRVGDRRSGVPVGVRFIHRLGLDKSGRMIGRERWSSGLADSILVIETEIIDDHGSPSGRPTPTELNAHFPDDFPGGSALRDDGRECGSRFSGCGGGLQ